MEYSDGLAHASEEPPGPLLAGDGVQHLTPLNYDGLFLPYRCVLLGPAIAFGLATANQGLSLGKLIRDSSRDSQLV
jgi:hypothetical protein